MYIISNPDIKNSFKLGLTGDRNKRLEALGPGAPRPYKIEYSRFNFIFICKYKIFYFSNCTSNIFINVAKNNHTIKGTIKSLPFKSATVYDNKENAIDKISIYIAFFLLFEYTIIHTLNKNIRNI